jgi:uncharacterized membrane protein
MFLLSACFSAILKISDKITISKFNSLVSLIIKILVNQIIMDGSDQSHRNKKPTRNWTEKEIVEELKKWDTKI